MADRQTRMAKGPGVTERVARAAATHPWRTLAVAHRRPCNAFRFEKELRAASGQAS